MSFCSLEDAFGQPFYYNTLSAKVKSQPQSAYFKNHKTNEITCEEIIDHITSCDECMAKFIQKRNHSVEETLEESKNIENFINLGISSSKNLSFFATSDNIIIGLLVIIFAYLVARKK